MWCRRHASRLARLTLLMLVVAFSTVTLAQESRWRASTATIRQMSEDVYEAANRSSFYQTFAPDYARTTGMGERISRADLWESINAFADALPDLNVTARLALASGEWAAARYHFSGTFENPLALPVRTIEPNGQTVEWSAIVFSRFDAQGRIIEEFAELDNLTFYQEIGLLPRVPRPATVANTANAAVAATGASAAQSGRTDSRARASTHKEVAQLFVEAVYGEGDLAAVEVTNNFEAIAPEGEQDLEAFAARFADFRAAAPDLTIMTPVVIADGEYAAYRVEASGTWTQPYPLEDGELPPTGAAIHYSANVILSFDSRGRIAEAWVAHDNLALMRQLGIAPLLAQPVAEATEIPEATETPDE